MLYLLLAFIVAVAPPDIQSAEITENGNAYFKFSKLSDSQWRGTHSSGKQFIYTVEGNTVRQDDQKPEDVIERVGLDKVKSISDLKDITEIDKGSVVWKLAKEDDGLTFSMVPKEIGSTKSTTYSIAWSQ